MSIHGVSAAPRCNPREVDYFLVNRRDVMDRSADPPVPLEAWTEARRFFHDHPRARKCDVTITHPLFTMEADVRFRFLRPLVEDRFAGAV